MPIETYMQAPQAVFIGDSIISGNSSHQSFLNTTETTNIASTIERKFSTATGYTYQNMGIGGQGIAAIASRFTADVINLHPRVVVIEGGVNDIQGGATTKATFLANWTTMLDAAQADSGITKILVLKILPWTNGTNTQMQTRDDWNNSLATLASGYSKAVVVDASSYVGLNRVGGDSGNLWDIISYYTDDGVHFTSSGHFQIAQALADSIALTTTPTVEGVFSLARGSMSPTIPAGGFAVLINGGAPITKERVVNLEFKTEPDIASIVISMDKNFNDTAIKSYWFGRKISFDLCSRFGGVLQDPICPDGKYSVFAKFYTAYGAVSEIASSTITLVTTPSSTSSATSTVKNGVPLIPSEIITSSDSSHISSGTSFSVMLSRGLKIGMRGEDVRNLQRALAAIPNMYPEQLVTGYFGRMTEKAVQRFQLKFGIVKSEQDVAFGYVGPKTRLRLRAMFP
jgi:lysophospholipase L1-like esterase